MNDIKTLNTVVSCALAYITQVKDFSDEEDAELFEVFGEMFEELCSEEAIVISNLTVKESVALVFDFYKELKNKMEVN